MYNRAYMCELFTRDIRMLDALGGGVVLSAKDLTLTRCVESLESDAIAESRCKKVSFRVKPRGVRAEPLYIREGKKFASSCFSESAREKLL